MHRFFLLSLVLLSVAAAEVSAQVSGSSQRSENSRSFHADAAALSESVDADGTKRGECAYYASDGQQIKVRFIQRPGSVGQHTIIAGTSRGLDAATAYQQCLEQARRSQINANAFQQQFNSFAFNPFAGAPGAGFDAYVSANAGGFGSFPAAGGSYAGAAAGAGYRGGPGGAVGAPVFDPANQIAVNIENQRRTMHAFNQQMQQNVLQMQQQNMDLQQQNMDLQQNIDLQHRLMQQFGR